MTKIMSALVASAALFGAPCKCCSGEIEDKAGEVFVTRHILEIDLF